MRRTLLTLSAVLPSPLGAWLARLFWRRHWRRERGRETLRLGKPAPDLKGSERAVLCEAVAGKWPFARVLELGSGFGQTFDILAPLFPEVEFHGIDIDSSRVEEARRLALDRGRSNLCFSCANAADLSQFPDNHFDLVISSAALLFLDPDALVRSLAESARVAARALLFLEQHESGAGRGYYLSENQTRGAYWIRDWRAAVGEALPGAQVILHPVPNPLWTTEKWQEYGCLVEVRLAS